MVRAQGRARICQGSSTFTLHFYRSGFFVCQHAVQRKQSAEACQKWGKRRMPDRRQTILLPTSLNCQARFHLLLITGELQLKRFQHLFSRKEGFTVAFSDTSDGTKELRHSFPWQDLIKEAREIMFFGPQFQVMRSFNPLLRNHLSVEEVLNMAMQTFVTLYMLLIQKGGRKFLRV